MRLPRFQDRSINQKLFLTYVLLIIVPLSLISIVSYHYSISFLEHRIIKSFTELNRQMMINTDSFLKNMLVVSESPFYDQELLTILSKDYSSYEYPVYEKASDYKYVHDVFFRKLFLFNRDIHSIVIYANNNDLVYRKGYQVIYNYDYQPFEEDWFKHIQEKQGQPVVIGLHKENQVSNGNLVMSVGQVIFDPETGSKLGTIIVNFHHTALQNLYQGLEFGPEAQQIIVDENNMIMFSKDQTEIGLPLEEKLDGANDRYYMVNNSSQISNWTFHSIIHKETMFQDIYLIRNFMVIMLVIIVIAAFGVAYFMSRMITNPIKQLSKMMRKMESGNLQVAIAVNNQDEIGRLSNSFNKMAKEMQVLISRIKQEESKKRTAELNALQTQINPHFLYNTLSVVRWMSKAQMADNITETLDSLIYLLTFSARNMKEFVTIEEEMTFIRNYVSLLELRYYNTFEVRYEVDEQALAYETLKFIIQPFVENAIFHGFTDEDKDYHLYIGVRRERQSVQFVIKDNGVGMSEEQISKLMNHSPVHKGMNAIGVRNVAERIALHFGPQYGVKILSGHEGTEVVISIPIITNNDQTA